MTRINTNIASVIAQNQLNRTSGELTLRLERLATGLRINRGQDDPAGLIVSERLRSDLQGVNQGIKNAERANSVIATTEAALAEVGDLLNSIRSLIVEAANTGANSQDERRANQLQIDSAIDSITRISNTASFGGLKLLNGTMDYSLSGVRASAITKAKVWNTTFTGAQAVQVNIDVVASAQRGQLFYRGDTIPAGVMLSAVTLEVAGNRGVQTIQIASGQSLAAVINAINQNTAFTGVEAVATAASGVSGIVFQSTAYGRDSFVSVRRQNAPNPDFFNTRLLKQDDTAVGGPLTTWAGLTVAARDKGRDVSALVNGVLAVGNGLQITLNSSSLSVDLMLSEALAIRPQAPINTFHVTGGGALFQLGQEVSALQQASIGIPSMASSNLGATLVGSGVQFLNSLKEGGSNDIRNSVDRGNFSSALEILDSSITEVSFIRGRLGAFGRNVLDTNIRSLQAAFENLSASESVIRDADFAHETSKLTRAQILASAGTSALALANQQAQQVLQLLG
ncbi:MAG: flagellin [Phycisphaerae bacterium]|nr:flagellin [Phycisphaerae bacterium]